MNDIIVFLGDYQIWFIILGIVLVLALIGNLSEKKEKTTTIKEVSTEKPTIEIESLNNEPVNQTVNNQDLTGIVKSSNETLELTETLNEGEIK